MSVESQGAPGRTPKRSTLLDVARRAGLSHQTVSRYYRDNGEGLKAATKTRIESAIAELDYRPNLIARSMRTRRTGRLAIVLPGGRALHPTEFLNAAAELAREEGFTVEMVGYDGDAAERLGRVLELADWGQVEGVLSISPLDGVDRRASSVPIVVAPEYDDDMRALRNLADGDTAAEIIEHLAGLGHRTFLHIAGDLRWTSARNRRRVYQETIDRLGLTSYGIVDGDWSAQSGFDAVMGLPVGSGVTAIFAASDQVAVGVVRAAWRRGWKVPDDLSVWGWDDQELSRFAVPAISTVTVDRELEGRFAMRRLVAAVRGEPEPLEEPSRKTVNRLVDRESAAPGPFAGQPLPRRRSAR
ncbi:transcriptional regulator [Frondihabitans sucicola]|uniref:Transcriptional regulator n=1 Tax=Frondihabitans sucicola TaxID=1268041 RepID=A0ABN6XSH4_9MICO|nr:LacI family DNA-binding transcriptional regulator [Frondihabitans sucicola]BDZ47799.1 transcriptional regulator [Frondihabitans sucicola]BDZ52272.1 transcriptional regulator [Frondihabitans sucicola]